MNSDFSPLSDMLSHRPRIVFAKRERLDRYPNLDFYVREYWALAFVEYSATVEIDGTPYLLGPETCILFSPGTRRRYLLDGPSLHRSVHFRSGVSSGRPMVLDCGGEGARFRHDFDEMLSVLSDQPQRGAIRLWDMLWRLTDLSPKQAGATNTMHSVVRKALRYIQIHLAEPLRVAEIARSLGISHNHLTRLFHADLDCSPVRYIRQRRMEQAEHLLRHTSLPIKVVAARVGIPDLQKFNRTAHCLWECSPSALRKGISRGSADERRPPR